MSRSIFQRLTAMGRDIKLSHSVFALPFALLAAFMAATTERVRLGWQDLALVVGCMFFARSFAMLANRYVDRTIDAANPRTAGRALPSGRLKPREVMLAMLVCVGGLIVCAAGFGLLRGNWWPVMLSPIAIVWLGGYGLAKRYTAAAHFVLGVALGLSPIGAAIAVAPSYLMHEASAWLLAGFIVFWVGGFDVIYALADIDCDRAQGLHSIPAGLGRGGALIAAKVAHLVALLFLVGVQNTTPAFRLHRIIPDHAVSYFTLGLVVVALLLIAEHRAAARGKFNMAFFTLNGIISCLLAAAGIADLLSHQT